MSFVETPRFPDTISQGSQGSANYSTSVVTVKSGYEVRNSNWTESRRSFEASFGVRGETELALLLSYFHAMFGMANTFRFKDWADFKSVNVDQVITDTDQAIGTGDGATTAFQLIKNYTQGLTTQRDIKKPVSGTVVASIGGVAETATLSIDTTTGIITFDADNQKTINGATSANPTELTTSASHSLTTGDTVYLSTFTGAGSWLTLNSVRYVVTVTSATTFTIEVDASSFPAYSSNGGQTNTLPQTGESIAAGYEFDVPCRFDTDTLTRTFDDYLIGSTSVPIIEVRL